MSTITFPVLQAMICTSENSANGVPINGMPTRWRKATNPHLAEMQSKADWLPWIVDSAICDSIQGSLHDNSPTRAGRKGEELDER